MHGSELQASLSWWVAGRGLFGSDAAYEAWTDLPKQRGLRAIVAAGVLAANPHNSQPWRFALGDRRIDVRLDLDRALGPVDPFLRQMHLGIGCALENLVVAASMQGLGATAALLPDRADPSLAARLALSPVDHGLAMQPLDQWLEVVDRARQRGIDAPAPLEGDVTAAGLAPVMMFRCGVALRPGVPSARRPLDDVITDTG